MVPSPTPHSMTRMKKTAISDDLGVQSKSVMKTTAWQVKAEIFEWIF